MSTADLCQFNGAGINIGAQSNIVARGACHDSAGWSCLWSESHMNQLARPPNPSKMIHSRSPEAVAAE
jgi:hypothetical protein